MSGPFAYSIRYRLRWASLFLLALGTALSLTAQPAGSPFWKDLPGQDIRRESKDSWLERLEAYRGLSLDISGLREALQTAPREEEDSPPLRLAFPLPDGSFKTFALRTVPVMAPGLAARYPAIRAYGGRAVDGSGYRLRFDVSPRGLRGVIAGPGGRHLIEPFGPDQPRFYAAYPAEAYPAAPGDAQFRCGTSDDLASPDLQRFFGHGSSLDFRDEGDVDLRVYRLAMACTVEYTAFHGGTRASALAAMVSQVNRLNEILEREVAIRLELVEKTDSLIFVDSDEYTNGNTEKMLEENPPIINRIVGVPDYDIGHVLGTSSSLAGVAFLGSVCTPGNKARGVSTMREPRGDPFVVSVLAHEIGHQLGATHTFNSCHNITGGTAFEPGGGTTIMSYAGICSDPRNNLQDRADPYFHTASLEQILFTTRLANGNSCPQRLPTGNHDPSVRIEAPDGLFIPIATPFRLRAEGIDRQNEALAYAWEQFDLGPLNAVPGNPEGNSPLFRSLPPTENPERVFPALRTILDGRSDRAEVLPTYTRDLTFRCTVRDNAPGGGGLAWEQIALRSDSTAGPFRISSHNQTVLRQAGQREEVRWDVAGTDNERVRCRFVNILLSVDGGLTFTDTLARQAPNNGSAFVQFPDIPTDRARLMVEAADNIFFDISDANFAIQPPESAAFALEVSPRGLDDHCLPEPVRFDLRSGTFLDFDQKLTLDLVGNLPAGASYAFTRPVIDPALGEGSTLTIDLGTFVQDTFDLAVRAVTESGDTSLRKLQFSTISSDFSGLRPISPVEGARNITFPGPFRWRATPDAEQYRFELARQPNFRPQDLVRDLILADTAYQPELRLPDDGIYYWRVTPINQCGTGLPTAPRAFQSGLNSCRVYTPESLPVNIPGTSPSGTPVARSVMTIDEDGLISDVNVPLINARFQPVRSLRITLTSPAGTTVTLLEPSCGGTLSFLAGFDDEAPDSLSCPPDDGLLVRPVDSLAQFRGENIRGDWTLTVVVAEPGFGAAGALVEWSLEFCAPLDPQDPSLSRLDTLFVPPGLGNTILPDQLTADGPDPGALSFTLLDLPSHGQLLLAGDSLRLGDRFTQQDIDDLSLAYRHTGTEEALDSFLFMVRDDGGGWLPRQVFPIAIRQGALVDTEEIPSPEPGLTVMPNPARDQVMVRLEEPFQGKDLKLQLFDAGGRLHRVWRFDRPTPTLDLSLHGLAAGLYVLRAQAPDRIATERLLIQP